MHHPSVLRQAQRAQQAAGATGRAAGVACGGPLTRPSPTMLDTIQVLLNDYSSLVLQRAATRLNDCY
jgi:hypothetical protein